MTETSGNPGDDARRDEAVASVLAMVPPGLGGQARAVLKLRALPLDELLRMRAGLEDALTRILPPTAVVPDKGGKRLAEAGVKVRRGLARLEVARDAIRASRGSPGAGTP